MGGKNVKPTVFNYEEYEKLKNENEKLKMHIKVLESEKEELLRNGMTVTEIVHQVKNGMCKFCRYEEDCYDALNKGDIHCPLNLL